MDKRHEIGFASYDRLFPNQDTMPNGGFGNLIALPLQKAARESGNSEFVDENFISYEYQWQYLSTIPRISNIELGEFINELADHLELGEVENYSENSKPWIYTN